MMAAAVLCRIAPACMGAHALRPARRALSLARAAVGSLSIPGVRPPPSLLVANRPSWRLYSSDANTVRTLGDAEERILKVLGTFDKVDPKALSISTPFVKLGLDSLDTVEFMIAVEEEFHMEIPDAVADKVQTPAEVAKYVFEKLFPHKETPAYKKDSYSEADH